MALKKITHKYNNYGYQVEFDIQTEQFHFTIEYPDEKSNPQFLFKYYSLETRNVDALVTNYLFASHPDQINDKYDCSSDLIDYSAIPKDRAYSSLVLNYNVFSKEDFNSIWESEERWKILRAYGDFERARLFMKFGIISLSAKDNNTLLWSYYAQNSGFAIKLKTSLLPDKLIGPFYTNYTPNLTKIVNQEDNPPICLFYQINIKDEKWVHEEEWRYLTFMPDGKYHPDFNKANVNSRKFYYNKDAIEGIILGYNFFNIHEISRQENCDIVKLKPVNGRGKNERKLKRKLLTYIIKHNISVFQIVRKTEEFELFCQPCVIDQISCNIFRITISATS